MHVIREDLDDPVDRDDDEAADRDEEVYRAVHGEAEAHVRHDEREEEDDCDGERNDVGRFPKDFDGLDIFGLGDDGRPDDSCGDGSE